MKYLKTYDELFEINNGQKTERINSLNDSKEFAAYGNFVIISSEIYFRCKENSGMYFIQVDVFNDNELNKLMMYLGDGYVGFIDKLLKAGDVEIEGINFNLSQMLIGIVDKDGYMYSELIVKGWDDMIMFEIEFYSKGNVRMYNTEINLQLDNSKKELHVPKKFVDLKGKNDKKTLLTWIKYIKEDTIVKDAIISDVKKGNFSNIGYLKGKVSKDEWEKTYKHLGKAGDYEMFENNNK